MSSVAPAQGPAQNELEDEKRKQLQSEQKSETNKSRIRDVIVIAIAVVISVAIAFVIYHFFLTPPSIDWATKANKDQVELILTDAYWFHELYMRWTGVDWFLTFLATGTALSAVIKNSVSVRSQPSNLSGWDQALIVLALVAVLGSTFDSKLRAGQLADRYRAGDLILQDAAVIYAGSDKGAEAKDALQKKWLQAQSILERGIVLPGDSNANAPPNQTPKNTEVPKTPPTRTDTSSIPKS